MTKQEIFDKVWDHFVVKGNPRSQVETPGGDTCRFRQDQTAACPVRCAVGLFIPDDAYVPAMDDSCGTSTCLRELYELPPEIDALFEEHDALFYALQQAHDSSETPAALHAGLRNVARRYSLTVPAADSLP